MTDPAPDYGLDAPPDAPPPVTPWLPGRAPIPGMNYGRLTLPGINDKPQPYVSSVKPDDVTLDEEPAPGTATPTGPGIPQTHSVKSFRVLNDKGEVVADMPDNPTAGGGNDYYKMQVKKIGDSLVSQAVNPADKEAAARATEFGLSLVGLMPLKEIQAAIVHRYDTDERNSISRETQAAKTARAHAGGAGGPAGPSKADKFQASLDDKLRSSVDGIIKDERSATKYAAISEQENSIAEMDRMMSSANSMAQRIAVMEQLKNETGKVAVESERAGITGAAGKWEEIKNKLSLWTSEDPQLSQRFVQEFRGMLATQKQYIAEQKAKIAETAAQRAYAESFGYPDDQRQLAYSIVKGTIGSGGFEGPAAYKASQGGASAPAQKPTGGPAVSSHLQKFLK